MSQQEKENQLVAATPGKREVPAVAIEKQPFVVMLEGSEGESEEMPEQLDQPVQPSLITSIHDHLMQEDFKNIQRSLYKESAVKLSVDKEFAYLFEDSAVKHPLKELPKEEVVEVELNEQEEQIAEWLQGEQQKTLAKLSFRSHLRLLELLASKLQRLAIVVTNFHGYYSQKLEQLNLKRKVPMQWACLSTSLSLDIKSKILEMYELGKLKLLLVSPELFENEQYHSFECQLLAIMDVQLYLQPDGQRLLQKIMMRTSPKRVLGCYEHISPQAMRQLSMSSLPQRFNPDEHILLKTAAQIKDRTLMSFIEKGGFSKVLIVVPDRRTATDITETLSLQSLKTANLHDILPKGLINNFSLPHFLTKQYKNEALLRKLLERVQGFSIVVSVYFQGLKLLPESDVVVLYSMPPSDKYLQVGGLAKLTCGLVCSDDYHHQRNLLSSALIDENVLDRILNNMLELNLDKNRDRKQKRFFSQSLDDVMLKKFSVDKQDYMTSDMKTIKVAKYCNDFEITRQQFDLVMTAIEDCRFATRVMRNVSYECWIQESDVAAFRELYPQAALVHNKVNLLNVSNQLNLTTKQLVSMLRKHHIRYSVCEEILPLRVLSEKNPRTLELVAGRIRQLVYVKLSELDVSYGIYERTAYPNLEFFRRDRSAVRRSEFTSCLESMTQEQFDTKQSLTHLPHQKINNLREQAYHQKTIELWLDSIKADELGLNPHQVVLFLQGIATPSMERFQSDALFRSYFRYRYEELLELVQRVMSTIKKVKTE